MGVGAGLYMCDVVVKKGHVRYLISWWILVIIVIVAAVRVTVFACSLTSGSCNVTTFKQMMWL